MRTKPDILSVAVMSTTAEEKARPKPETLFFSRPARISSLKLSLGNFFFRTTKICSINCGLTIIDIHKRFFATNIKRNGAKSLRATFFDFVPWTVEESDKVENYRFLEICSIDFDENQAACLLLDTLSAENIKSAKIKI